MDAEMANMLWEAMTVINAQEMLVDMNISAYPHMKEGAMKKYHRDLYRLAYPAQQQKRMTMEDLKKALQNG